jgi:uncharacterized protein YbgA (DUF1722 family)
MERKQKNAHASQEKMKLMLAKKFLREREMGKQLEAQQYELEDKKQDNAMRFQNAKDRKRALERTYEKEMNQVLHKSAEKSRTVKERNKKRHQEIVERTRLGNTGLNFNN